MKSIYALYILSSHYMKLVRHLVWKLSVNLLIKMRV